MTTNYIDHKISTRVSSDFRRVVTGKTDIVPMQNGRERRNAAWAFKRMQFTASYALLTPAAQDEVMSAFYAANAQLLLFRFRDAGDYRAVDSPFVTAVAVGTTDAVQLTKRYTFGSVYADRVVQAVSTCVVKGDGGAVIDGAFDTALGLFTPTDAWGSGVYTWSGTFDLWVRFNSDELDVTMKNIDIATVDIDLIESLAYDSTITGS